MDVSEPSLSLELTKAAVTSELMPRIRPPERSRSAPTAGPKLAKVAVIRQDGPDRADDHVPRIARSRAMASSGRLADY